jgi:hypothetical protein
VDIAHQQFGFGAQFYENLSPRLLPPASTVSKHSLPELPVGEDQYLMWPACGPFLKSWAMATELERRYTFHHHPGWTKQDKLLKTGAGGGGRTLMPSEGRGILSPVRLLISISYYGT